MRTLLMWVIVVCLAVAAWAEAGDGLTLPVDARFINGTGQLPLIGNTFKAPGFTSQGYIEACENAGPSVFFIGINSSEIPLTIRCSYKTTHAGPLTRITFGARNAGKGTPDETVVAPWEFYVSDPMPLTVKAGDLLYLRTFVKLEADTQIGCGTVSCSLRRPDNRWAFGNIIGDDRTLDPEIEKEFKPTNDLLYVPFLLAGTGVRRDAPFVVGLGDSLSVQLSRDTENGWFGNLLREVPHCNTAIGGDALGNVLDTDGKIRGRTNKVRFAILRYATDVINFYGHNDLGNGCPLERMIALEKALCARPEITYARKWRCTLTPFTHNKAGVDVKALTEADQTPDKYAPVIVAFNKAVRAEAAKYGYDGVLEFGGAMATGLDSMFWKPGMAADGTHFERLQGRAMFGPEIARILPQLRHVPEVSAAELAIFPQDANVPGDLPEGGVRYWATPFTPIPCHGCYVTVVAKKGEVEVWTNSWGDPGAAQRQLIVQRGATLATLGAPAPVCDGTLITDVPDPAAAGTPAPKRGYTRTALYYDAKVGYVMLCCVASDYLPGSVPLLPALLTSKTGAPGTWTYAGKLSGDPATEAAARRIWSDGGSLVRLDTGKWRVYLNGFGPALAALESDTLAGPWRFLRDAKGEIRELLPAFKGGCFPTILRVGPKEWHCWITDKWPPQSIWHFYSEDGLAWRPNGRQPEITRALVEGHGIKCLRPTLDPDGKHIIGLLSVWTRQADGSREWQVHTSRMPVGPPPAK
jgi:hypothetical protein